MTHRIIEKLQKTSSSLISAGGGAPPTGGPSAVTSTLKLEAQKSSPPNNPLSVKNHPKNLKSLRGYVELNFKCPLLTRKNNSNCWQPTGRLYFATSKRSTADGPPRRTIKVKTPSIHPYLTNTLKVESQFLCVFDVISIDNNIHKVRVYIYIYIRVIYIYIYTCNIYIYTCNIYIYTCNIYIYTHISGQVIIFHQPMFP